MSLGALTLVLAFCLLAGAFFAGMETGIVAINRLRLRHLVLRGVRGARRIERFVQTPERLLGTTLIGTNLSHVAASVFAARIGEALYGDRGVTISGPLLIVIVLVFCEYIPKAWFQAFPARRVLPFAPLLSAFAWLFAPLRWILATGVGWLLGALRRAPAPRPWLTREDLLRLAAEGEASGLLTDEEIRMIRGVFQLSGKTCGEIMVPRARMVAVDHDLPAVALIERARASGFNRFPVWHREKKAFVGVVHVLDVLRDRQREQWTAEHYARPPQLVAARMLVDHVLPRIRVTRQPMVLVVDDQFEVIGWITLSDVLAEIVGES